MTDSRLKTTIEFTTVGGEKVRTVTQILSDAQRNLQKTIKTTTTTQKDGAKVVVKATNDIIGRKKDLARQMAAEVRLAQQRNKILADEVRLNQQTAMKQRLAIRKSEIQAQRLLTGGAQKLLDRTKVSYDETFRHNKILKEQINTAQALEKRQGKLRNGMMSWGFSMLFTGMVIQKFFSGIARSLINTFQISQGQTAAFNQTISRLSGAWEYLKWSIMSALEEAGVIDWVTDKITRLINWVEQLSPAAKTAIGVTILFFVMLGTTMLIVGQILLFLIPIVMLVTGNLSLSAALLTSWKILSFVIFRVLIPLLILYALAKSVGAVWGNMKTAVKLSIDQIKLYFESWGLSMALSLTKMSYGWKLMGLNIKKWLITAFDFVASAAYSAVNGMINAINSIAPAWMQIKTELVYEGIGTDGVQGEISALMAEYNPLFSKIALRQAEIFDESKKIREGHNANWADAGKNLGAEWGFGSDTEAPPSISPEMGSGDFGGTGTGGGWGSAPPTQNITVNLTQQPGEDSESFYKRLIEEFQHNTNIVTGSTGAGAPP
jgi:hypothetical protein